MQEKWNEIRAKIGGNATVLQATQLKPLTEESGAVIFNYFGQQKMLRWHKTHSISLLYVV